jgi:hypothetical protein
VSNLRDCADALGIDPKGCCLQPLIHRRTAAKEVSPVWMTFQQVSLAAIVVALIVLWAMLRGGGK